MQLFGHSVNDLNGKVCWITGASSGIGESLAYLLATNGVKLVLSGTNHQRLQHVKTQCVSFGQLDDKDVLIVCFDIKDHEKHQQCLEQVLAHFKRLDILVSNAGRSQRAAFQDIEISVDKEIFDINVFGLIGLARVVLKYFLEQQIKGQFVVTSSAAGKIGAPQSSSYTGSKHALHGYFECLRNEVQSLGMCVTVVCPGPVHSRILESLYTDRIDVKVNNETNHKNRHRMETSRCAYLMAVGVANRLDELWICRQPLLSLYYLTQYAPTITRRLMPRLASPERLYSVREGVKQV
ncbi:unnamed protein product [Medioppia subpectinata]|uniref:Dehydrogenase/reductase SDR family member 7 n=1 Tax=Medioppia subpectinata TaxID=1979941 RepID=A0A7R9QBZ1_9ACAR|nr:unnamed protein product [Medioppia subpectinata]CAG2117737.1 unnamed protein product [Medioppia subpectinata]